MSSVVRSEQERIIEGVRGRARDIGSYKRVDSVIIMLTVTAFIGRTVRLATYYLPQVSQCPVTYCLTWISAPMWHGININECET
jgi:hypothetical protein